MTRKSIIAVAALLFISLVTVSACAATSETFASGSWRYKIVVTIETPEGDKTGSAVREVTVHGGLQLLPEMASNVTLKGEAVVVDLGKRGLVFATLVGPDLSMTYASDLPGYLFMPRGGWAAKEGIEYLSHLKTPKPIELKPKQYPIFVRFKDIGDPLSVEKILEMKRCNDPETGVPASAYCVDQDNFEKNFGSGVRLKSISLQMTDEPVTWGIKKTLSWLPSYYGKRLDGTTYWYRDAQHRTANDITYDAFSTGE